MVDILTTSIICIISIICHIFDVLYITFNCFVVNEYCILINWTYLKWKHYITTVQYWIESTNCTRRKVLDTYILSVGQLMPVSASFCQFLPVSAGINWHKHKKTGLCHLAGKNRKKPAFCQPCSLQCNLHCPSYIFHLFFESSLFYVLFLWHLGIWGGKRRKFFKFACLRFSASALFFKQGAKWAPVFENQGAHFFTEIWMRANGARRARRAAPPRGVRGSHPRDIFEI